MDKGLLIKDLAEEVGVSVGTVINCEKRGRLPTGKSIIRKLSDAIHDVRRFF